MDFETPCIVASPTGAKLAVRHEQPAGNPRAILLLLHGICEHAGRYGAFARAMAARGFCVYAHDHRGHGRTEAPDAPLGRFADHDGAEKVVADCLAVRDHAGLAHPGLPVVVFGHSMGGLIALNFAEAYPESLDALAVWNANFAGLPESTAAHAVLAAERMFLGSDVPSWLLPRLTFGLWAQAIESRRTDLDWLSRDPAVVDAFLADPLCGFAPSVSMWRDVFTFIRNGARRDALRRIPADLPIDLVGGSRDPATRNGRAVLRLARLMRKAGLRDVSVRIDQDARHETLNDLHAERAIADFAAWADRAIAPRR